MNDIADVSLAVTVILLVFVLYHRIRAGRALRRLMKSLEEQRAKEADRPESER